MHLKEAVILGYINRYTLFSHSQTHLHIIITFLTSKNGSKLNFLLHKYRSHRWVACISIMASPQVSVFGNSHSVLGAMEVANKPDMGIPEMYIRPHEPSVRSDEATLPTIPVFDFQTLVHENSRDAEIDKLSTACKDWGFFQVSTQYP